MEDVRRARRPVGTWHNLREPKARPYSLNLVAIVGFLAALNAAGYAAKYLGERTGQQTVSKQFNLEEWEVMQNYTRPWSL